MRTEIRNTSVLDTTTMTMLENRTVVIEDDTIVDVTAGPSGADPDVVIDGTGAHVVPGIIDAHVHFRLATLDFAKMTRWSEVEFGIAMATLSRQTLERGVTTVRDLGGDVEGLRRSIAAGRASGPHIVRAGRMLSQTGGHGDTQGDRPMPDCACSLRHDAFGIVCDGPDAVRSAARHNLRDGSDFLKIHVSGGVATPRDPLESIQYTPEEVRAAVVEARHRGTYVAAHAYLPEAIRMAVDEGVHSIEHGNLVDDETAAAMAAAGAVMVPTIVTYDAMHDLGRRLGFPARNQAKNDLVRNEGRAAVERAVRAGVTLGLGTDLIGESQDRQLEELRIRAELQPVADVLHSMWVVNAGLCRLDGTIGVVAPGSRADLILTSVDPLVDLTGFTDHERTHRLVMKAGTVAIDRR